MTIRSLAKEDYLATCRGRMTNVTDVGDATVDIWSYVAEAKRDLEISDASVEQQLVDYVYRSEGGRFDHVLIPYGLKNVYLAIIVDLPEKRVHGHYLLDLNEEYGIGHSQS